MATQITEKTNEGLSREFSVVVPATDIEEKMTGRLTEIGTTITLPGFRPGKAPIGLLKKRFGEAVRGEVVEQAIQEATQEALTDNEIRPAMEPKIEIVTFEDGADLEYTIAVETLPEIEQMDLSTVELERMVPEIPDENITESIQNIADQRKTYAAAEEGHAAEDGDQVTIDFVGKIDGEEFDGGKAEGFALALGSGQFIPGFEEQLIGSKGGEDREVKVSFPDDYPAENLAGKEAVFEVKVNSVEIAEPVEIDDELAKAMGLDDLEALQGAVREQLEREYAQVTRARIKRDLLDKLADGHTFELPPGMVQQEFDTIWTQVKDAIEQDNLDEDDKGKSEEELEARYREIAERRVKLGLVLSEIGRTNNIQVGQEDLNRAMAEQAQQFPGQEARIFEYYQQNPEAMQELQAPIYEEKVVDFIVEMAKVDEKTVPVDELMADPEGDSKD